MSLAMSAQRFKNLPGDDRQFSSVKTTDEVRLLLILHNFLQLQREPGSPISFRRKTY